MKSNFLSTIANNINPSATMDIDAKAKALIASGQDVCKFGSGEPDFDTPDFIKDACHQALRDGKTKYIPQAGLPQLRKAIAEKYINHNHFHDVKDSQVVVSPGGKFSCYLALLTTCNPGDEVIIPAPYWVSYPEMATLVGAIPKIISTDESTNFKISPEQLKDAISPKTRLLILNSPSNPTGTVYSKKEIEDIVQVALSENILILSDEIYEYLLYDGATHTSPASVSPDAANITLTVSGFSKTFSMTGWRLGTLVAPEHIAKAAARIQSHTTSCTTSFAQYGALAAMENKSLAQEYLQSMLSTFDSRRQKMTSAFDNIDGISCYNPEGAFYVFPKIDSFGLSSTDFSSKLLDEKQVAVVPGSAFGSDKFVRLSYATSDETIEKGLQRIESFCSSI